VTHLVDANALIWSQDKTGPLGTEAEDVLTDMANRLGVGIGTLWEIAIKVASGKLALSKPLRPWIDAAIQNLDLTILDVSLDHIERLSALPDVKKHKDPFDRILAAQALVEGVPIISIDTKLDAYGVTRIWN